MWLTAGLCPPATESEWLTQPKATVIYLQDLGLVSCTAQTIKYLAYETDRLPRPAILGRKAYWRRADLDRFVESL